MFKPFPTKEYLWNRKIPWMVKVLQGTIDANNEPLFFKSEVFLLIKPIWPI